MTTTTRRSRNSLAAYAAAERADYAAPVAITVTAPDALPAPAPAALPAPATCGRIWTEADYYRWNQK